MDAVTLEEIESAREQEDSATVASRVLAARTRQRERYRRLPIHSNAQLDQRGVEQFCQMDEPARKLLRQAVERFHISMRTYARIRKVALTLADLASHDRIQPGDVAQAIQLRNVEGRFWR